MPKRRRFSFAADDDIIEMLDWYFNHTRVPTSYTIKKATLEFLRRNKVPEKMEKEKLATESQGGE